MFSLNRRKIRNSINTIFAFLYFYSFAHICTGMNSNFLTFSSSFLYTSLYTAFGGILAAIAWIGSLLSRILKRGVFLHLRTFECRCFLDQLQNKLNPLTETIYFVKFNSFLPLKFKLLIKFIVNLMNVVFKLCHFTHFLLQIFLGFAQDLHLSLQINHLSLSLIQLRSQLLCYSDLFIFLLLSFPDSLLVRLDNWLTCLLLILLFVLCNWTGLLEYTKLTADGKIRIFYFELFICPHHFLQHLGASILWRGSIWLD